MAIPLPKPLNFSLLAPDQVGIESILETVCGIAVVEAGIIEYA